MREEVDLQPWNRGQRGKLLVRSESGEPRLNEEECHREGRRLAMSGESLQQGDQGRGLREKWGQRRAASKWIETPCNELKLHWKRGMRKVMLRLNEVGPM